MARILIVGDGAIGLLLSHFLGQQHKVQLLSRKSTTNTRFYSTENAPAQAINAQCVALQQLNPSTPPDLIIFTVKAFQVQSAFSQLKAYIPPSCDIVLCHNGMGNVEEITEQLAKQHALYFLTTSMAGFKSNDYIVQHTGKGQSVIGPCNELAQHRLSAITQELSAIPLLQSTTHIATLRFEKLMINIAINPLTALHNIKNGQLRAPEFNLIITNLLTEACQIAQAQGIHIRLVDALERAYQVMMLTGDNYSSMHQDIAHNRETEIAAICGYISEQGQRYNIKTPFNDKMCQAIKAKKSVV